MQTVGMEVNETSLTLHVSEQLTVSLPSNPSTGYAWKEVELADLQILRLEQAKYVSGGPSGTYGSGGQQVWQFTAVAPGDVELRLRYQRPWDDGTVHQTFALRIHVEKEKT